MINKILLESEFVDRDAQVAIFEQVLSEHKTTFLVFYGVGGIGKTWLLNKLMERSRNHPIAYINFGLAKNIDFVYILVSLRNQLGGDAFSEFDDVLDKYVRQLRTIYLPTKDLPIGLPNVSINIRQSHFEGSVGDIVGIKLENVNLSIL